MKRSHLEAARAAILASIGAGLRGQVRPGHPPAPRVVCAARTPPLEQLAATFCAELRLVGGDCCIADSESALREALTAYLRDRGVRRVAAADRPLLRRALCGCAYTVEALDLEALAGIDCAALEAEALLADSGSAIVALHDQAERLLPLFAPACVVVARMSTLHPGMDHTSIDSFLAPALDGKPGQTLIITGPSRTADIEKTLVLGAHGPRSLGVFVLAGA